MRLFGKVNGKIDRFDRAGWFTRRFDLAFADIIEGPFQIAAGQGFNAGTIAGQAKTAGALAGQGFNSGTIAGQSFDG